MNTWSSAYRDANGDVVEITSDLQQFDAAEMQLRAAVAAAGGGHPLFFRDDRGAQG